MTWAYVHDRFGRLALVCPLVDAEFWWFPWTHWVRYSHEDEGAPCP